MENGEDIGYRRHSFERMERGGPGTELALLLTWVAAIRIQDGSCHCDLMRQQMDAWGKQGCRDRRDTEIVPVLMSKRDLLQQSLAQTGHLKGILFGVVESCPDRLLELGARRLVDLAIWRAAE